MNFKKFSEFVNENENTMESDTLIFLIDGVIYWPYEYEFDIDWEYEPADSEVGISGGYYPEDWNLIGIDEVIKIEYPGLLQDLEDARELAAIGLGDPRGFDIYKFLQNEEMHVQVIGPELEALNKKFVELWKSKKLKDHELTGKFDSVITDFVNNVIDPPERDYDY